jgi:hypothetical protein
MAMTYTSLSAAKGTSGALATWVDYTKLDVPVTIDEAQTLLYSLMRTREMKTEYSFTMTAGSASIALPSGFLDPIGRIFQGSFNRPIAGKDDSFVRLNRVYTELTGTLGTNPFTTTNGSNTVAVALTAHGFNQDSMIYLTGATAFNGATINGTFPITSIIDTNDFNIDITVLGTTPSASGAGGGSAVAYTVDNLVSGQPNWYAIWDEAIHFDQAFFQQSLCKLGYYKSPPLLSSSNLTNFLTNRYPQLLRTACMAAAADFMKDDVEYQKSMARLQALVERVNIENEMYLRGMELDTITP